MVSRDTKSLIAVCSFWGAVWNLVIAMEFAQDTQMALALSLSFWAVFLMAILSMRSPGE